MTGLLLSFFLGLLLCGGFGARAGCGLGGCAGTILEDQLEYQVLFNLLPLC